METARKVVGRPFQRGHDPRRNYAGRRPLPLTQALTIELTEEDARQIAAVAISQAKAGDPVARAQIWDRLEGKAIAREERGEPGDFDSPDIHLKLVKGRKRGS